MWVLQSQGGTSSHCFLMTFEISEPNLLSPPKWQRKAGRLSREARGRVLCRLRSNEPGGTAPQPFQTCSPQCWKYTYFHLFSLFF